MARLEFALGVTDLYCRTLLALSAGRRRVAAVKVFEDLSADLVVRVHARAPSVSI